MSTRDKTPQKNSEYHQISFQLSPCPERRYFSTLHYLALVCEDEALIARLKQRPAWRTSNSTEMLERMVHFNRWLKEHAAATQPPMTLYDTTHRSVAETVEYLARWVRQRLEA